MKVIPLVVAKLRSLFRQGRDDAALAEELDIHADLLAADLVRDGLAPDEARRRARLRLGGTDQVVQATRDQRGLPWLELLGRDLKLACRSLRRNPLFTVTATATLAVGVAANTVGFGFLYGFLLRPLPFTDGSRLVSVLTYAPSRGTDRGSVTIEELAAVRQRAKVFDRVEAMSVASVDLVGRDEPRRLMASVVSPGLFRMLGIQPVAGRLFDEREARGTSGRVVLIGETLWRTVFAADPAIVGRVVTLDLEPYTVVGVLPSRPAIEAVTDLSLPIGPELDAMARDRRYRLVAHLAPGASIDSANRDLKGVSAALAVQSPTDNGGFRLFAEDFRTDLLDDNREPVLILYGVVTLILLLACANVATLLVMRSVGRSGEFAIRASLGAGRLQIVRQILVEHAVVTAAGGALGVLVGVWMRDLLPAALTPTSQVFGADLDGAGVALLTLVVLTSAFLFGALSAWSVAGQVQVALVDPGAHREAAARRGRLRTGLAVFEVATAVLVLVGTGLLLKGALRVAEQPPGFDPRNLLTMEVNLPDAGMPAPDRAVLFFRELVEEVGALPGVESVSAGNPPPYVGWSLAYEAEKSRPSADGQRSRTMDAVVMPGYFRTLRVPLLEGRDFDDRDAGTTSVPTIIVSKAFARATWPGESAVGRHVRLFRREGAPGEWREVVGVVGDTRASTFAPERGWVYLPQGQRGFSELILMIRFKGDVGGVVRGVQRLVWKKQPGLPVHWNHLLEDLIAERYWQPRVYPMLSAVFALLSIAVALVGVYAVVAYAGARRAREFGIRLAIGAPPASVWQLVVSQGLRLAFTGTAIGLAAAFGVMRLASSVFFGVSPTDGVVYAACAALAAGAVLVASAAPAFRAARIDPVTVLRCE